MRIGFDVSPITPQRTGVGNYCLNLLRRLVSLAPDRSFTGLSSGSVQVALGSLANQMDGRHIRIPTRLLYASWSHFRGPKIESLIPGVDVYHATNFFLPPSSTVARVLTLHDLAFLVHPELCNPRIVGPFSNPARLGRFVREADAILTYSESTRRDAVQYLDADAAKITVAPIASDEAFVPVSPEAARQRLRAYGINGPYFLFVGAIEPRKNVANVVRAFSALARDTQHCLALVGPDGWKSEDTFRLIASLGLEKRVVRPGFVPQEDLPSFYSAAESLLFPTRYEGFGLPIIEAMACGCPIVTSDNSSVREVAGGSALYADCDDVDGIAAAARALLEHPAKRDSLTRVGLERARLFSWDACARKTFEVYQRLAQEK